MIVYASLEPFAGWMPPLPGTPFFLVAPWPRVVRFDVAINVLAYAPFGLLLALIGRRRPAVRLTTAIGVGTLLSFAMESAQTFLPTRDASSVDLISNSLGTTIGAVVALAFNRAPRLRERVAQWRYRVFLEGRVGDFGLALLGVWLISQINPGIPLFAATFDPSLELTRDLAGTLLQAAQSAFNVGGVGVLAQARRIGRCGCRRAHSHAHDLASAPGPHGIVRDCAPIFAGRPAPRARHVAGTRPAGAVRLAVRTITQFQWPHACGARHLAGACQHVPAMAGWPAG